jgi:O-methyltransferase involved in polyketide biosynthesis
VSLGEGLETQGRRVDNGRLRWLSVDLPDAIRLALTAQAAAMAPIRQTVVANAERLGG